MVFGFAQAHDLARECLAAAAAVGPDGGQHNVHTQLAAQLRQQCDLAVGIRGEAVDGHDAGQTERVADAAHMVQQVRHAAAQCVEIFRAERAQGQTAVHFQCAHRRHHDGGVRPQPGEPALDVQKFFRAEVGAKAGLRHGVVAAVHGHACSEHAVASVRDVGKRPAVHESRCALKCLHEVGLERVAQQRRHRAHGLEIGRRDRPAVIRVAHDDAPQPRLQIGHGLSQTENRHDLAGDRDVEPGGSATRLYPLSKAISKQIMPVYDKPMIYYPLSTLMLAGIREVLIISTPRDLPMFRDLLGTGEELGMSFSYKIQEQPNGLAQAFVLGADFLNGEPGCLILGDNMFYGQGFSAMLRRAANIEKGACIFGYYVKDPRAYGVVEFNEQGKVISLEEKPEMPKSNYAVPGLYFYDASVTEKAAALRPSARGEYEITDLNRLYLEEGTLKVELFGRGFAWLDTGNCDSLLEASNFVATIQNRQGFYVSCIEEIAWRQGWIPTEQLLLLGQQLEKTEYGKYLIELAKQS